MSLVAVDLAARYSAACWMSTRGRGVIAEWDSWQKTEAEFIDLITSPWREPELQYGERAPDVMVVEDLPHRLPFSGLVKAVSRIQGRIVERMYSLAAADCIVFVPPAEWRRGFDGMGRGTGPDVVVPVSAAMGYTSPDLTDRAAGVRGGKAVARKVGTDYCAAFLIATWAMTGRARHNTWDLPGTTRYGQLHPVGR